MIKNLSTEPSCKEAIGLISQCLNHGNSATSLREREALDHVNACTTSRKCISISVDYYEQLIKGKCLCGAGYNPNPNFGRR